VLELTGLDRLLEIIENPAAIDGDPTCSLNVLNVSH
jgi:hypothetical protein